MNQILKDKYSSGYKKELKEEEYKKEIEASIKDIDDVINLVSVTKNKIDSLIDNIKSSFSNDISNPELINLLNNLYEIRKDIIEKEFEINMIKSAKEKGYQKKKRGNTNA